MMEILYKFIISNIIKTKNVKILQIYIERFSKEENIKKRIIKMFQIKFQVKSNKFTLIK